MHLTFEIPKNGGYNAGIKIEGGFDMESRPHFFKSVCALAVPVALQSMLQSSFSIVDQIMIGQLGSISVAGVGLAGKFASIYSVAVSAVGAVAGIMISQYLGQKNSREVRRSFYMNLLVAMGLAGLFTLLCLLLSRPIMGIYTADAETLSAGAGYLRYISLGFLPLAGSTLLSALFRCMDQPRLPLYASILSALINTGLNYLFIFGGLGLPPMGILGAALATVIAQSFNFLFMGLLALENVPLLATPSAERDRLDLPHWSQYLPILLPLLVCELIWSLGENAYAVIYGRMGTAASAAMTLTNPIQGLLIGALCGLSQAAGIIVGKALGSGNEPEAYADARTLILYGAVGALFLSWGVVLIRNLYVDIYQVDETVKLLTKKILLSYALIAPFKVLNMILGGGILRSGGKTDAVMVIDLIGTWGFGVPLGLLAAFVFRLPIPQVYFILSLEECVRFAISMGVFRSRRWMHRLAASA